VNELTSSWYHTLWLTLDRALRDHGIVEEREKDETKSDTSVRIGKTRQKIREESERSAVRISGLVSCTYGFRWSLTIDYGSRPESLPPSRSVSPPGEFLPASTVLTARLLLYHSIYEAGLYLAEQGREECMILVVGLRQHCIPYPQFWTQAEEIERLFNARLITGPSEAGMHSRNGSISHPPTTDPSSLPAAPDAPVAEALADASAIDPALKSISTDNDVEMTNGFSDLASLRPSETEADKYLAAALVDWLRQPQES
jgi:hypothetical protein